MASDIFETNEGKRYNFAIIAYPIIPFKKQGR